MAAASAAPFETDQVPVYEIEPRTVAAWRSHVLRAVDYVEVPAWAIVAGGSVLFLAAGMLLGALFHI